MLRRVVLVLAVVNAALGLIVVPLKVVGWWHPLVSLTVDIVVDIGIVILNVIIARAYLRGLRAENLSATLG